MGTVRRMRQPFVLLAALTVLPGCGPSSADTSGSEAAIAAVLTSFTERWIANDSAGVMATLSEDAVFIPHHGYPPQVGDSAIRAWWWPSDSPAMQILTFTMQPLEVRAKDNVAVVRGVTDLRWIQPNGATVDTFTNYGTYLVVLARSDAANWQITHIASSDTLAPAP